MNETAGPGRVLQVIKRLATGARPEWSVEQLMRVDRILDSSDHELAQDPRLVEATKQIAEIRRRLGLGALGSELERIDRLLAHERTAPTKGEYELVCKLLGEERELIASLRKQLAAVSSRKDEAAMPPTAAEQAYAWSRACSMAVEILGKATAGGDAAVLMAEAFKALIFERKG